MKICFNQRFLRLFLLHIAQIVVTLPTEYVHMKHIFTQNNARREN